MMQPCYLSFIFSQINALENTNLHPMVRHEAAEALGAIGGPQALPVLQKYADHELPEVPFLVCSSPYFFSSYFGF